MSATTSAVAEVLIPQPAGAPTPSEVLFADLSKKMAECGTAEALHALVATINASTQAGEFFVIRKKLVAAVKDGFAGFGIKVLAGELDRMFPATKRRAHTKLTHYSVAQYAIHKLDGNLRFNINTEQWIRWTGQNWQQLTNAQVGMVAREAASDIYEAQMRIEPDVEKLDALESDSFRRGVVGELTVAPEVHVEALELDSHPGFLTCGNGVLDLETAKLVPGRDLLLTVRNRTNYVPGASCPTFMRVLREAFEGRADDIAYYELVMGYTMQANPAERAIFFHKGEGTNGKSLLLVAIRAALGDHGVTVPVGIIADGRRGAMESSVEGASPVKYSMKGKRLAYIDEVPVAARMRDADMKLLAGGSGELTGRLLRGNTVEFPVTAVLHIACNNLGSIPGGQAAVWKRVYPIAYTKTYVEDPTLADKLRLEHEGVLAWLVECSKKYRALRSAGGKLVDKMPASCVAELEALKAEQHPFLEWLADNCEAAENGFMPVMAAFQDFTDWTVRTGAEKTFRGSKSFVQSMRQHKVGEHREQVITTEESGRRLSGFVGWQLKLCRRTVKAPAPPPPPPVPQSEEMFPE